MSRKRESRQAPIGFNGKWRQPKKRQTRAERRAWAAKTSWAKRSRLDYL